MLIKMKESKGFTLVELMIVVAIIGILAAVAVPFYQRYVAKSRLTSLVFPGLHAIQNSITTYYSVKGEWPTSLDDMTNDADTTCFNVDIKENSTEGDFELEINLRSDATGCDGLEKVDQGANTVEFSVVADESEGKITWSFAGDLADELGL